MTYFPYKKRLLILLICFELGTLLFVQAPYNLPEAEGHVGGGEAPWVISHYQAGNLALTPDLSLPQWTGSRMLTIKSADRTEMNVMCVHNGTYVVFLVQRILNVSLQQAGALIAFEGQGVNGSDQVWFWTADSAGSAPYTNDATVHESLVSSDFTVTFGRTLAPENSSSFAMKLGVPYDDFIKVTTWSNGSSIDALNLDALLHMGLEVFPFIDVYPKIPLAYGVIILVATFLFLLNEMRKYRRM